MIRVASRSRADDVHGVDELPELLPQADVVIVITPLTPTTRHLVDGRFLATMRDGALLVNVSRGGVVDTDALVTELQMVGSVLRLTSQTPSHCPPIIRCGAPRAFSSRRTSAATRRRSCRGRPAWCVRKSPSSSPASRSTVSWPGLRRRLRSGPKRTVTRSEQEFRDFVAGFADPLARLAFLLSAGTELDPVDLTVAALASVRRRWDDVEETGAPEPLAIEALVSALPRARRAVANAERVTDHADVAQPVALAVPALGPLPERCRRKAAACGGVDCVEGVGATPTRAAVARGCVRRGPAVGRHRDPAVVSGGPTSIGCC